MSRILRDVRYALRGAIRSPAATTTILLTLALGTGASIAIFSIVDAALVRPLPYPDADRLAAAVQVSEEFGTLAFAPPFLHELRTRSASFEALAGFSSSGWTMTMTGAGEPRVVSAAYVSDGLLEMLGVRPSRGRHFTADEHAPDAARTVIVSAALWASTFGQGTDLGRQSVLLGGVPFSVVGVLPPDFTLPMTGSIVSANRASADLLLPFGGHWSFALHTVPIMNIVGRIAPGRTVAEADAELEAMHTPLTAEFPDVGLGQRFRVRQLAEMVAEPSRPTILMLSGAAFLLLVIGCVNVANIMLARATARRREILVRAALGAGYGRLATQALTEAMVLAASGSGAGFVLATWVLSVVPSLGLATLPPSARVSVDARVAGFSIVLAIGCAAAFGLLPVLYAWRLRPAGVGGTGDFATRGSGSSGYGMRRALVVGEVAVATVLLIGAGLLSSSFMRLSRVDPGFRTEGLWSIPLAIADTGYDDAGARGVFMTEFLSKLGSTPGVQRTAAVNRLPLGGSNVLVQAEAEGQAPPDGADTVDRRVVTPGYFDLMGIALIDGRDFASADDAGAEFGAAIVNQAAVDLFWPDRQVVGRRLRLMLRSGPGPWMTVVGVVSNVLHHGLAEPPRAEIYVPYQQASVETMVALARMSGMPPGGEDPVASLKRVAWDVNPDLPMDRIESVETIVDASVSEPRLRTAILTTFAALALALAAIGVAGVVSYSVIQRRRDIAVRVALGARSDQVLRRILGEGLALGVTGAAIGLVAATVLARALDSLLFEVGAHDPLTYASVASLLVLIVAMASYLPARGATRVDPIIALRSE